MLTFILNGNQIQTNNPKDLISMMFQRGDLKHWSEECLNELYKGVYEITVTILIQSKMKGLTRFINICKKKLESFENKPKEVLLKTIYNEILTYEGHPLLHGFGIGNKYGDRVQGNSEIQSIVIIKQDPIKRNIKFKRRK